MARGAGGLGRYAWGRQDRPVAGRQAVLARLVGAQCAGHHDPARQAELHRREQRGTHADGRRRIRRGAVRAGCSMFGIGRLQDGGATTSAYDPAAAHPHRILDGQLNIPSWGLDSAGKRIRSPPPFLSPQCEGRCTRYPQRELIFAGAKLDFPGDARQPLYAFSMAYQIYQGTAARLGVRDRAGYCQARYLAEVEATWSGS
jgi:hypothetical protein